MVRAPVYHLQRRSLSAWPKAAVGTVSHSTFRVRLLPRLTTEEGLFGIVAAGK